MSRKQFDQWLQQRGVEHRNGRYYFPCKGSAPQAEGGDDTLVVTISTAARDRHGDILEPAGVDLAAFRRNPVVLWAHNYDEFPIGRADEVWVEEGRVAARVSFDSRPFAREARRLYAEGVLSGWSVGCLPRKWEVIEDEKGRFSGYHVTAWELLELSAVPVPANPEALTREIERGAIADARLCKALADQLHIDAPAAPPAAPPAVPPAAPCADEPADTPPDAREDTHAEKPETNRAPARPEVSAVELADAIFPHLLRRVREWAGEVVAREIRRRQGRLS